MNLDSARILSQGVLGAVRDVANEIILPRFRQLAQDDMRAKTHPGDMVTIADEESERALGPRLRALLPDSQVVGEEAAFASPAVLDLLQQKEPVWIIDPIDGTLNFINGVERFAVIIALVQDGVTRMGWIYDPTQQTAVWAAQGEGVWRANAADDFALMAPVAKGPAQSDLGRMVAAIYNKDLHAIRGTFARNVRLGSAAHDYLGLVEERIQVLAYKRLKPWDHAAGLLIHTEWGGYNRMLSGAPYNPALRDQAGVLCAPNAEIWQKVHALIPAADHA